MANLVSNIDGVLEIWDDGTVNIVGGKLQIDSSDVLNNNNNALFSNVRVGTLDFGDASPTLSDNGNYLRIQTSTGFTDIGCNNTSFSHFYTDRNAFYFDKRIQVNSGQVRSHDEDLNLNRAGSTTARLRLTSGTTISDQDFSVTGDVTISGDLTVSGDTVTLNTTTITAEDAVILLNSGQTTPANDIGLIFQRYSTATSANYNPVILWEESSDKFVLGSTTEAAADADIGLDQQWLVVTSSGNVGIGSNTPGDSLVVSNGTTPTVYIGDKDTAKHANLIINRGSTSFDANLMYKTGNVTKWRIWLDGIDNTLQVRDEANASNIMTWETGGNVGINVDDPNAILHIKDGTNPGTAQWDYRVTADFQANNGNTSHLELIQIRDSGGVNDWTRTGTRLQQRIDTTYMGYMQFNGFSNNYGISWGSGGGTAGPEATTEKMCLDQDGNLGIGTTNPSEKLHVSGNIAVTGTVDGRDIATDGTKLDGIETGATADQTAAQLLAAIKTVDVNGSSGLNAGRLDGHALTSASTASTVVERNSSGDINARLFRSEYDSTNASINYIMTQVDTVSNNYIRPSTPAQVRSALNVENGATADQTAAQILTAIKTVDGASSGLDADTVDGIQASNFLRSDTADTATGKITFNGGHEAQAIFKSGATNFDSLKLSGTYSLYNANASGHTNAPFQYGAMITAGNTAESGGMAMQIAHERTGTGTYIRGMNDSGDTWYDWREIWTSGTDGSGSGLDADLLDGQHGSYYMPASTTEINQSNQVSGNAFATTSSPGGVLEYQQASGLTDTKLAPGTDWYNSIRMGHGNPYSYYSNTIAVKMTGTGVGDLYTQTISNNVAQGWNKHWHNNNDGSGSGLDADTVDGIQGSSFLRSDTADTMTGNLTIDSTDAWNAGNGMLNVGGASDGRIQVRHIWGKDAGSAGTDHLWLNYSNASKHVQIGASGGGNDLYVSGFIYEGGYFTGNRVLTTATGVGGGEYHNYGTISIGSTVTTTALLITDLTTKGFFNQNHSVGKCSWSYAGNGNLSDTGFGTFELAGCVVETFKDGNYKTVRITRPNTGSDGPSVLVYNDQGSSYNPGWREMVTSFNGTTNITGQIRATSDITAYYSDERLKDISGKIENALDKVCSLNGYHYTGNEAAGELGYDTDVQQVGISAQEVEAVLPEVVKSAPINDTHDTDYKTVQYERLIPLLIESVKEQQTQIDQLKDMVKKLTQK